MQGEGSRFAIRFEGTKEALATLGDKRKAILDAMHESLVRSSLKIRGTVVSLIGQPGFPRYGTGRLSRGVRSFAERAPFGSRAVIGVESKVPYGRILELGGIQPGRTIRPVRKRALRWTGGMTRLGSVVALGFGATRKQAFAAPRSKKGRTAERADTHFARFVVQGPRYQRAIPYFGPGFEMEREGATADLKARLAAALKA